MPSVPSVPLGTLSVPLGTLDEEGVAHLATNKTRIVTYVNDEVAAALENERTKRGLRSISATADAILTEFATGKASPKPFKFESVADQHPELKEDEPSVPSGTPTSVPSGTPDSEDVRTKRRTTMIASGSRIPLDLLVGKSDPNPVRDWIANAPPSQPARTTYVPLEPRPETMPGLNTHLQPESTSAPTASQSESADFTTAPPTPIGSGDPHEDQKQDDYFGWRSEQAR